MEEQIEARIKELEMYREKLVAEANRELSRVTGAIDELKRLLTHGQEPQAAEAAGD